MELFLQTPLFETGVFLFGLLFGSFLNVVIHRVPARLDHEWRCQCQELLEIEASGEKGDPPGTIWGRSKCPKCGHLIRAWENIPLLSWIILRGKCASCQGAIPIRYPIVELITGIAFLVVAMHFGPGWQTFAGLILTGFLIALSGIDSDHQLLPDNMTLPLLWIGLLISPLGLFTNPVDSIIGAATGYLSLWMVFQLFRVLTGKEGMGYGDFKLLAGLGAWMGWQALPMIILLSSLVGAVSGLMLMALRLHKKDQPLPFGPFIAAAGWIALLWGDQLLQAYLDYSGLG